MSESEILAEIEKAEKEIYIPAVMKAVHDNFDAVYWMKPRSEPFLMNIEDIKVPPEWRETSRLSEAAFVITQELLYDVGEGWTDLPDYIRDMSGKLSEITISHLSEDCGNGRSIVLRSAPDYLVQNDPHTNNERVIAQLRYIVIASADAPALVENGVLEKVERDDVA